MFKKDDRVIYHGLGGSASPEHIGKEATVVEDQPKGGYSVKVRFDGDRAPIHFSANNFSLVEKEPTDQELADRYRELVSEMYDIGKTLHGRGYDKLRNGHCVMRAGYPYPIKEPEYAFRKVKTEEIVL